MSLSFADTATRPASTHGHRSFLESFGGYITVSEYYDNNVFNYSSTDRREFDTSGTANPRFGIKNLADFVTDVGARLDYTTGSKRKVQWRIRGLYDANVYARNAFRNYNQLGLELRVAVKRSYLELAGRWLPKYYLRNLYWRHLPSTPKHSRYAAADYTRLSLAAELGTRISRRLDGQVNLEVRKNDYAFPFNERDNTSMTGRARLKWRINRKLDAYLQGSLGKVAAAGKDSVSILISDISNRESGMEAGVRLRPDRLQRVAVSVSFAYSHQRYTSVKTADRSHYYRKDNEYDWDVGVSWQIHRHWQPGLLFSHRRSVSTIPQGLVDVGSFNGYRFGFQFVFTP